ncbi:MAG TPA: hypothetical protein DDZ67_00925, partial [Xanthomonadaceae bacterium]|nr:hypothetical protein [Xanthomonadaceae bacterium]
MDGSDNRRLQRLLLVVLIAVPLAAQASGARQGVTRQPGEIVLLRDVSARPAYRPAPPGVALIADPSPRREVGQMLGLSELSDDDYAAMGSGSTAGTGVQAGAGTTVERMTGPVVNATPGRVAGSDGVLSGSQL